MAAEASRSSASADSYIGSLISLTSKCEIRYEGVLYNINTEESSIGLKNVRSFGTEGRKKDGPQVPPSDKVYEYILFRGSDIKDLQVKSSPPVQSTPSIHIDPAIIQSHYPHPASTSTNLPSSGTGSTPDISSHAVQLGFPRSTFQGGLPLYQHGGGLGSWGSSPSPHNANGSGLAMPMYWQGFYGPASGLTHVQQQPLLRPPPGLSVPPSMQQPMQYSAINASFPTGGLNLPPSNKQEISPPLQPSVSAGSLNLTPTTLPPSAPPSAQFSAITSAASPSLMPNKPTTALPTATLTSSQPLMTPLTSCLDMNPLVPPILNKSRTVHGPSVPFRTTSQSLPSVIGISSSSHSEVSSHSLVTPGQLLHPASNPLKSYQSLQKDVEVVQVSSAEPMPPAPIEAQSPILPTPSPSGQKLVGGGPLHTHPTNRGRERGRGNGILHPVTRFSEEFDFMAMNEKFKKDEVWGHLGKSKLRDKNGDGRVHDEDYSQDEDDAGILKLETKPVYVKDEFFDLLSCNALDSESRHGRTKFSDQMKIDTETFGEFPRHRGGRGGRGYGRGGGRIRGSYYGRGYGYGYVGRGRGHMMSGRTA